MSIYTLLFLHTFIYGASIWVEPSWVSTNVNKPSNFSIYSAQIFGAKGEEESLQIHISSDNENLDAISLEVVKLPIEFPPPKIYLTLPIEGVPLPQGGIDRSVIFFDILKPAEPLNIPRGQQVIFWVTFCIPRDIKAGNYHTEITVNSAGKKIKRIPVDIDVFDFEIPQKPSLPAISFLDWKSINSIPGNNPTSNDFWLSIFNLIQNKRIALSIGTYLQNNYSENLSVPRDVWDKLIQKIKDIYPSGSNTILDVTPLLLPAGPLDTVRSPSPEETQIWNQIKRDIPQTALVSILFCPSEIEHYESLKRYLNSLAEQTPSILRILCSPPFPQFNFYTDVWAIPYNFFSTDLIRRFNQGISITDETNISIKSVSASSCGFLPGSYPPVLSSPWNTVDNCIFTGWLSLPAEKDGKNEWIEIYLKNSIAGNNISMIWGIGQIPHSVEVSTSRDGIHFFPVSINWKHITGSLFENPISQGSFKYNPDFIALRVEFKKAKKGDFVFIQEIKLNTSDTTPEPRIAPVIKPWLWITPEQYPSLRCDVAPIEARIIPWICWHYQFRGAVLTPLNSWGSLAFKSNQTGEFIFQPQNSLQMSTLLFPALNNYYISIRLERLRDGLEDYEYLLLLAQKAQTEPLKNKDLHALLTPNPEQYVPWNVITEEFIKKLISARIAIGYELSGKTLPEQKKSDINVKTHGKQITPLLPKKVQKNFTGRKD